MSISQEINALRKNNRLEEALALAHSSYETQPNDRYIQLAYGWVIYTQLKQLGAEYNPDNVAQDPTHHFKKLEETLKPYFYFNAIQVPDLLHSLLMTSLLKYTKWPNFIPVANWFAKGNAFLPQDMQPTVSTNGTEFDSLYIRFHHALAKALNNNTQHLDQKKVSWAFDSVKLVHEQYPTHPWLNYELSKYYLARKDIQQALAYIQPLFNSQARQAWLWGYLATIWHDIQPEDSITCYYQAISLAYKEEILVGLRIGLADLLAAKQDYTAATYQIKQVIATRTQHNWRIPDEVVALQHRPWFIENQQRHDLPGDKNVTKEAEALLGKLDTRPIKTLLGVIERSNRKLQTFSIATKNDQSITLDYKAFTQASKWPIGTVIELSIVEHTEEVIRVSKSAKKMLDGLYMPFSGSIERIDGKDFAFLVASKKTKVFVPPFLLQKITHLSAEILHCMAVLGKDKHNKKGWKALTISEKPFQLTDIGVVVAEKPSEAVLAELPTKATEDIPQAFTPTTHGTMTTQGKHNQSLPTHHICLISDAPMTTIGPLIDEAIGAQSATLVFVKGSKQLVTNLQKTLSKRGISVTLFEIANMFDSRKLLEAFEILKQQHANGACLNLTGGSKLMLLAAKQVFHEPLYHQYYIHYNDSIQWLNQIDSYHPISDTIDLTDYFMAMGYEIKGRSGFNPQLKDLAWIKRLFADNLTEHLRELLSYSQGSTTLDFILPEKTLPKLQALIDLLIDAGHVTQSGQRIQLSSPNTHTLLNGQWLEQWILAALAAIQEQSLQPEHQRLQDIQLGLKLSNSDFTYAEVNTPNNQQSIDNELDISCLYNNSLYLIECKSGKNVAKDSVDTALYKLHARKEQLGGLKGKALLISLYPLSEQKKTLAASLDISVIDGSEQLKNPISTLKSWLEQD